MVITACVTVCASVSLCSLGSGREGLALLTSGSCQSSAAPPGGEGGCLPRGWEGTALVMTGLVLPLPGLRAPGSQQQCRTEGQHDVKFSSEEPGCGVPAPLWRDHFLPTRDLWVAAQ